MDAIRFIERGGCPRFEYRERDERADKPFTFMELMHADEKKADAVMDAVIDRLDLKTRLVEFIEALEERGTKRADLRERAAVLLESEIRTALMQQGIEV